jgi:hypothetical protein
MPTKDKVIKDFDFVDGANKFFCSIEVPGQTAMPPWWWFRIEGGTGTRHAPFEARATDTKQSVQTRIIAYYAELLAIEARPAYQRPAWRKPERPTPVGESVPVVVPQT